MPTRLRPFVWIGFLTLLIWSLSAPRGTALAGEVAGLDYFKQAKINWRAYEGQRISLGLLKHLYTESLVPLLPQFEALTGIKLDYLILPELEYNAKLATDLSNQRGEFNVVMSGPMRNWAFVTGDWIVPLDPFLNNPKLTDRAWYKLEDFYPGLIAANRWDGTIGGGTGEGSLWTIPAMVESYILAYRKDILDRYKIKVPTSYEELAEAARLVKKHAGIDGIVARGAPNFSSINTSYLSGVKSYTDGKWAELDGKMHAHLNDPRAVKFTQMYVDMLRESGPANWVTMVWYDAMEYFTAGQAGMIPDCDFFAANFENPTKSKVAGKVGYALLPSGPAGKTYSGLWTWGLGMSKTTRNKEAAWLFIQWATSPQTLLNATVEFRNYNPTRASVMNDPRVQKMIGGWGNGIYVETVQKNFETARVGWIPQPERARVGDIWMRALHEIYFKRMSPEAALERANGEVDKLFTDLGLRKP